MRCGTHVGIHPPSYQLAPTQPPCSCCRDLLPCVVFVFSKKRIDALADSLQV